MGLYEEIGENTFLCGRFLNVILYGPSKVNDQI
jgi:hypothetical protein